MTYVRFEDGRPVDARRQRPTKRWVQTGTNPPKGRWEPIEPEGWYELVQSPRPADTDSHTYRREWTVQDDKVIEEWVAEPLSQDVIDQRARDRKLRQAVQTLRQWAHQVEAVDVRQDNAIQVVDMLVKRTGKLFDFIADLLVDQYGNR